MNIWRNTIIVTSLVYMLGIVSMSWSQVPEDNDQSDDGQNTGGGTGALAENLDDSNTAYGFQALNRSRTGENNTAIGANALLNNDEGDFNIAIGSNALRDNDAGDSNTAVGINTLLNNTGGDFNIATGANALRDNTTGNSNTAIGANALLNNTGGDFNIATGANALRFNNIGNSNTASGVNALLNNTSGLRNAAFGANALRDNSLGQYNTALGWAALLRAKGHRNLALGVNAGHLLTSGNDNIYFGNEGVGPESNTLRLGQVQTRTFIAGIFGRTASGGIPVSINSQGQLGTVVSSARYKRDIRAMKEESQGLLKLRPVTFRYQEDAEGQRQYGLIAEEVAKVYPELVVRGAKGEVEAVQYHELIPMLLNEVQHQQQALTAQSHQLAELKAQNARLQAALVQQNAALVARLEQLEQGGHGRTAVSRR
jgi:hypothetical protein